MFKRMLSIAMAFAAVMSVSAQQPQPTPLPIEKTVRHGVLPNGMNYYVLHNEEPKERANFYIAQKVGSTLETPEQLGLAHFLEHMAFNGTTNYPGKSMLNYLQSKGIRFGADINAYTMFDETVYNINNVPTTDKALMDSVLLVLHDWSGGILLEEAEIDAERGVIEEEWRTRNDANFRMMETILPKIYAEYQYQQMPIGKMEIVRNFPYKAIRDYYKKWYRPDQQGIVIVGDFDAEEMEKKVVELFSKIAMPEGAAERTYPVVSDNKKPIFVTYEDAELPYPMAQLAFKSDKTPFELRNTVEAYVQDVLVTKIIAAMINTRLAEYAQKPDCPYAYAGVSFSNFLVSKTKDAFNVIVVAKDDIRKAFPSAMAVVARACKTGFTDSELARVRDEVLASYERVYNERNKTNSEARANELIRLFIDNEPAPGAEAEYQLAQQVLPMLPVQAYNAMCSQLLTPENQVLIITQPKREGSVLPGETEMIDILETTINADYEAYVDEVITEPLIEKLAPAGKITATEQNAKFGTTEFTLSNGAKVIIKPTDFASDEVSLTAYRNGGKRTYPVSQAANLALIDDAFSASKFGNFDNIMMQKYLAGKKVGLTYEMGNATEMLNGASTVKDLKSLMELIYVAFTDMRPDEQTYDAQLSMLRTFFANNDKNPQKIFMSNVYKSRFGDNPLMNQPDLATINAAKYPEMFEMLKASLANPAEYTFIFVGNVDEASLKPMLETYIASIPSKKPVERKIISSIDQVKGNVENFFKQPMEAPATMVWDTYSGYNLDYNIDNIVKLQLVGDVLDIIYVATLREEEGGTYGAQVGGLMNPNTNDWSLIYTFQTNAAQQEKMISRAHKEFLDMLSNGASQENFSKVKEAAQKQFEINSRTNGYWSNNLMLASRGWDMISGHRAAIENLTLAEFNNFMKNLYDGKNRIQIVMEGVPVEKK